METAIGQNEQQPRRLRHQAALMATVVFLALALAAGCSNSPDETATDTRSGEAEMTTIAPIAVPTTELNNEEPASTTESTVLSASAGLAVEDDGYFPWIFPSPTLSWYEEGCPSIEVIASNFMSNFFDEPNPMLSSLSAADHSNQRRYIVHNRGEGGASLTSGTELVFERLDLDIVDCEAWGLVSAESSSVVIDEIGFENPSDGLGTVIEVDGSGDGFEALIDIRVHDESFRVVAEGFGMGGHESVQPFDGRAVFVEQPIDVNLIVIASSSTVADGATPLFAASKARCCDGLDVELLPDTSKQLGPIAVVNVASDDTLNVRSGPGVANDVVAELSPFMVGMALLDDAPVQADGGTWVRISDIGGEGIRGWVNSAFIVEVEGNAASHQLMTAAFAVREALSLNNSALRLGDVLSSQGSAGVTVSAEAFFLEDDQYVSVAELGIAGDADDGVRLWGYTDGQGEPIEANVADYFSTYARLAALTNTERVSVNIRLKNSNTIDNMADSFENIDVVEFHYGGGDGDAADFEWSTLRLGFEQTAEGPKLVAIAKDFWTV